MKDNTALPVAYSYELADAINGKGEYCQWRPGISLTRPNVPEGSIRNLRLLYDMPALDRLTAERDGLKRALENVKVEKIGNDVYIGVIAGGGCWSAKTSPEGNEIFLAWKAEKTAALASLSVSDADRG